MKRTSCVALGAIWFGAAVSVAEIEAGIQSEGNWPALILGHVLGGALLFAAWLAGTLTYHFTDSSPIGPTLTSLLVAAILALVPLAKKVCAKKAK